MEDTSARETGRAFEGARAPENFHLRPGMPVLGGAMHRKAPERLPEAARTPWEPRISRRSAGFRIGETPWGAARRGMVRPAAEGESARGDQWRRKPPRRSGDGVLRRGTSGVLGPWPRNQDGRAQALWSLRSLRPRIPQSKRPMSTVGERAQGMRRRIPASPSERTSESKPQERQRTQRVRKAGGSETRRGGEKPRGRSVPGEANPGHADLSADVAEGARNSRRGEPIGHDR